MLILLLCKRKMKRLDFCKHYIGIVCTLAYVCGRAPRENIDNVFDLVVEESFLKYLFKDESINVRVSLLCSGGLTRLEMFIAEYEQTHDFALARHELDVKLQAMPKSERFTYLAIAGRLVYGVPVVSHGVVIQCMKFCLEYINTTLNGLNQKDQFEFTTPSVFVDKNYAVFEKMVDSLLGVAKENESPEGRSVAEVLKINGRHVLATAYYQFSLNFARATKSEQLLKVMEDNARKDIDSGLILTHIL